MPSPRSEQQLLIVFGDITGFQDHTRDLDDVALADLLDAYYRFTEELMLRASGQIVKFMGDAFLAIWISDQIPAGLAALPIIKREVDSWFTNHAWDSRLIIKAHVGSAVLGAYGNENRLDAIGHAVSATANLPAASITLSADAFDRLDEPSKPAWQPEPGMTHYTPRPAT